MYKKIDYIDEKTGEIYKSKNYHVDRTFDDEKGYLLFPKKTGNRMFNEIEFPAGMTDVEIGKMTRLSKKIWSNTNMLGYRGNGGIRPYNIEMIAEVINLKPRQATRFIEKMVKNGIMAKVKVSTQDRKEIQYYLNPLYFFSSNRLSLNLYLIFREALDPYLPQFAKDKFINLDKEKRLAKVYSFIPSL